MIIFNNKRQKSNKYKNIKFSNFTQLFNRNFKSKKAPTSVISCQPIDDYAFVQAARYKVRVFDGIRPEIPKGQ